MKDYTRSQKRILQLLSSLNRPLSAQELYLELRQNQESMGLATVYRSLEALKLDGKVLVRTLASGESIYSLRHKDQHHLTCINCGLSVMLDECPVHNLERHLENDHQFKIYYHTLEFFGICPDCRSQENPSLDSTI